MAPSAIDPVLSTSSKKFLAALTAASSKSPVSLQLSEFYDAENDLRRKFAARGPVPDLYANLVPVFHSKVASMGANKTKARVVDEASLEQQYICALPKEKRRKEGMESFVQDGLAGFKRNWDTFTEGALGTLNWDNVLVAGGAVLACLQPLPPKVMNSGAKGPTPRALREYFHNRAYPASDIDLFLYGLDEDEAKEKMLEVYESIKACARADVTCVRSTHAVTIVCEWPQRHIQIILRLYSSPSEILAGFDVDACAVGYNGNHVFAAPRAFVSLVTQTVTVDMSRRSPSYELRLAKYAQRGYEIFVPDLRRDAIDPTIFDRSPTRLQGLARLLVLSVINSDTARNSYLELRREKRARPPHPEAQQARSRRRRNFKRGDLKAAEMDGLFENNYDSIHIPYGKRFNAKNIEKLMFQRDMVYNAEWNPKNVPPQREFKLHRHPCFFGDMCHVFYDCCGYCPEPESAEAVALQLQEDERFVRGHITFMVDDPGRQSVGSFHPITDGDWSEMAHLSHEAMLASAVAQNNFEKVKELLQTCDVNKRDHTGRTMLFLASQCGNVAVAGLLVENGARLTARNFDGRTVLHLVSQMGNVDLIDIFLKKSKANAQEKELREQDKQEKDTEDDDSGESEDGFEKIKRSEVKELDEYTEIGEDDILNLDLPDWDYCFTPLHHAIFSGHIKVVQRLIEEGVDVNIPVKIPRRPESALYHINKQTFFPIVLCGATPNGLAIAELLLCEGVSSQSDSYSTTTLHLLISTKRIEIVKLLLERDPKAKAVLSHITKTTPPLLPISTAVFKKDLEMAETLLKNGSPLHISMERYIEHAEAMHAWWLRSYRDDEKRKITQYGQETLQPLEIAVRERDIAMVKILLEYGAKVNSAPQTMYSGWDWRESQGMSFLDVFNDRIGMLQTGLDEMDSNDVKLEATDETDKSLEGSFFTCFAEIHRLAQTKAEEEEDEIDYSADESEEEEDDDEEPRHSRSQALSPAEAKRQAAEAKEAKKKALTKELFEYQELQSLFIAKEAKSWNELPGHELIHTKEASHLTGFKSKSSDDPSSFTKKSIRFNFSRYSEVPQSQHEAYLELFEMVWNGDVQGIKLRTLAKWGPDNRNAPLKVSVFDWFFHNTLVLIALRRKRFDLAKMLLQIAQAQYRPKDNKVNYYVDRSDSDYNTDSDDSDRSDYFVAEETFDNTFELGDVTHIPDEARSDVTALKLLRQPTNLKPYVDRKIIEKLSSSNISTLNGTALTLALIEDDLDSFIKILDLADEVDPDGADRMLLPDEGYGSLDEPTGRTTDFKIALILGRIPFIEEMIRRSAWGVDFEMLETELDATHHDDPTAKPDAPRFYSGLRVRGKYRRDWAKATAPSLDTPFHSANVPIGMLAAYYGNPQTIEWFFSDGPTKAVDEFIKSHKTDKRAELLEKSSWTEHIADWFGLKCTAARDNAFHAAIQGGKIGGIESVFDMFVKNGVTPLAILQSKQRFPKHDSLLISARSSSPHFQHIYEKYVRYGGDPAVTDEYGYNIFHILALRKNDVALRFCLTQVPKDQRSKMMVSRVARTLHTPIAFAVRSGYPDSVKLFLEHGTEQLWLRDGDGNLPIHVATGEGMAKVTQALIEAEPDSMLVEDTAGSLPVEIAEQRYLISKTQKFPFAFVYQAKLNDRSWLSDRPETRDPKTFLEQKRLTEKTEAEATLEVIKKAMESVSIGARKLVPLLAVSDVVRRVTNVVQDPNGKFYPGSHFDNDSLWKTKDEKKAEEVSGILSS